MSFDPPTERFEQAIAVLPEDIDHFDHVNNVVYVRWVQEVSTSHWNAAATQKYIFERHVEIVRVRNQQILARARSTWCPIDLGAFKISYGPTQRSTAQRERSGGRFAT
jgi:acyl-CoA thioesterase FadM